MNNATKRFALRRDENIIEVEGGGFKVEYLAWPNDPDCAEWIDGGTFGSREAAVTTILASRYGDLDV